MNMERMMKEGQRMTAEKEARELAIRISSLKREMRLYLADQMTPEELDAVRVEQLSNELMQAHVAFAAVLKTIAALREDLGLPRYNQQ